MALKLVGLGLLAVAGLVLGSAPQAQRFQPWLTLACLAIVGVGAARWALRARRGPAVRGGRRAALAALGAALALAIPYVLARPMLVPRVSHLRLLDYGIALAAAGIAWAVLQRRASPPAPPLPVRSEARRHERRVRLRPDAGVARAEHVLATWLERGEGRTAYAALIEDSLEAGGAPPSLVAEARAALERVPAEAPAKRGRALKEGRAARLEAHARVMAHVHILVPARPEVPRHG